MKLHLPKHLFTALVAAFTMAAPAIGLTLTEGYHKTYSLSENFSYTDANGNEVNYSNGTFSGYDMNSKTLTLNMSTTWTTAQALFIINPGNSTGTTGSYSVGLYATATGDLNAIASTNTAWETSVITAAALAEEGSQTSITVKSQKANNFGTLITSASGEALYTKSGLRYSNGDYTETYLNSNIISAIVVTDVPQDVTVDETKYYASNYTGSWEQQFAKDATMAVTGLSEISAETNLGEKNAIIVGNTGQLHLNASTATLSVAAGTEIYIGNTSYQNSTEATYSHAALRFENANAVDVEGNIYLVDNATAVSTGSANITLSGQVTDKVVNSANETITTNSTLLLKGNGYNFAGGLDVTGLSLASGASVTISGHATVGNLNAASNALTIAENGVLELGAATHSIGTLTASGTVSLAAEGILKLGTAAQTIQKLQLAQNSTLQGDFDANYRKVTIKQLDLATGAMASVQTQNGDHNGTYDILSLKGEQASLLLKNASSESNTTRFNLGGSAESDANTFTGHIYLIANQSNTTKRSAAINIKDGSAASRAVIHMLGISGATNSNLGLGIETDTKVAGINSTATATINSVEYSSPTASTIVAGSIDRSHQDYYSTAGSAVTLTINVAENSSYDTNATVKDKLNLTKTGLGSQTFSGDLSAFNGTVTVNQGTLALQSTAVMNNMGDITVTGGKLIFNTVEDLTGTITMTGGSLEIDTWNITTTQEFTTSGDIAVNIGAVNIAPANTLESSGADSYFTHIYEGTEIAADGNGYRVQSGDFFLFKGLEWDEEAWGALNVGGYGTVKSENGNTLVTVSNAGTGLFYINKDTTYTDANILGSHGVHLTQGKTLNLAIDDAQTLSTELTGEGSLKKSGTGTLTLSAANTYTGTTTIESGILALNLGQVDGENSIYRLNNEVNGNGSLRVESGTTLQNNGKLISSAIILNGGYLTVDGNRKLSANVIMENGSRLSFSNGDAVNYSKGSAIDILVKTGATLDFEGTRQAFTTGSTLTLAGGKVTGTGDGHGAIDMNDHATLTIKATEDSTLDATIRLRENAKINIDVADGKTLDASGVLKNRGNNASEEGAFTKKGTGELVLSATNTYSGGTTIEAGTVTTQNASALGSGGVTMTGGELKVTDVVDMDSDLSLKGMLEMNATASAKLATAGTTLNLGTTGSVKKTNAGGSQYVTISSDGATAASMTAKSANAQLIHLAQDASFTIQDMTLTNTTITAATTETRVNLSNVSGDATLDKGKFHMQGQLPVGLVNAGGSPVEFSSSALSGLTLNTADSYASLVVDLGDLSCLTPMGPGQYNLTITLSGFTMKDYSGLATGAGLVFAADSWLGSLLNQAQNANVKMTIAQAEAGAAAAAEGGSASGVTYSTGSVGTIINITGLNVPEPASATLGLAALMMLCARRRRKA